VPGSHAYGRSGLHNDRRRSKGFFHFMLENEEIDRDPALVLHTPPLAGLNG